MNIYVYIITGMLSSFLLFASLLLFYLKYRKNLLLQQYQLKEAEVQHQKALLHAAIQTQEQERKRIGMDLHDEVGSTLAALRLMIECFTSKDIKILTPEQFKEQSKAAIDSIIKNVRHISHNLSPLLKGNYGFYDAIHDYCEGINNLGKLKITLTFDDGADDVFLPENVALTLYRVISELINNTIKHAFAQSTCLTVSVENEKYKIDYSDDGIGLSADKGKKGMGLQNIESRLAMIGADYEMESPADKGFHIIITIPLATKQ